MMPAALRTLLVLGAYEHRVDGDVVAMAGELVLACDDGDAREAPTDGECVRALAVVWWMETRLAIEPPRNQQHGCGPGQVIPTRWSSGRIGTWWPPPCATLEVLRYGLAAARDRLRLAWARSRSPREAFARYNGSTRARWYGRAAAALYRAIDGR